MDPTNITPQQHAQRSGDSYLPEGSPSMLQKSQMASSPPPSLPQQQAYDGVPQILKQQQQQMFAPVQQPAYGQPSGMVGMGYMSPDVMVGTSPMASQHHAIANMPTYGVQPSISPQVRAQCSPHPPHPHMHASARARAHTHTHIHAHTSRSLPCLP